MKIWFSSIDSLPSHGSDWRTDGPPVLKPNPAAATPAPVRSATPARNAKRQFTPAGRSRSKSNTQLRASAQRPVPATGQSISNGSSSSGSPNGTMGVENRACTWRTPLTSPCGENCSTPAACAATTHVIDNTIAASHDHSDFEIVFMLSG